MTTPQDDDFAFEPVPGLPDHLPEGETLLWQGAPEWRRLARQAFHVVKIAAYFAVVAAWQTASALANDATFAQLASSLGWLALAAGLSIGILSGLAWLYARGTVYSLTSRRIVIRSGLALPITVNLPLALVEGAALDRRGDGSGSIALKLVPPNRIALLAIWPNARPWAFNDPQPMLRALPDVDRVATLLASTITATLPEAAARQNPAGKRGASEGYAPAGAAIA